MAGQNTPIIALDYNIIQSKLAQVLGTGLDDFGYGQSVISSQAIAGTPVSVLDWHRLRIDLLKARQHQTGLDETGNLLQPGARFNGTLSGNLLTIEVLDFGTVEIGQLVRGASYPYTIYGTVNGIGTAPNTYILNNTGTIVSAISLVSSKIVSEIDRSAYSTMATQLVADRLVTPPLSQASLDTLVSGVRTTNWNGTVTHVVTVDFTDANHARYFFNSGGSIRFSASRYGGLKSYVASSKAATWTMLLANMQTISFGRSTTSTTGSGTGSSIGFIGLTGTNQLIFQKLTDAPRYTPNQYNIYAKTGQSAYQIVFTIQFSDLSGVGTGSPPQNRDEDVDGTLTSTVQAYRSSGSNVSIASPAATGSPL